MKGCSVAAALLAAAWFVTGMSNADAAPRLMVTLTGTQGGPSSFNGLAGAGTLVRYGDDGDDCGDVKLQFDAGRGTTMRLSQIGLRPDQLKAVFLLNQVAEHQRRSAGRLIREPAQKPDFMQSFHWALHSIGCM